MKRLILILSCACCYVGAVAQVSLDECQMLARENYPLIKQYDLIDATTSYSVSNAKRAYLPQVSLSVDATYQSDAMAFPEEMGALFSPMGINVNGLSKDQYRVGVDVNQHIWDGGKSKSQQKIDEAEGDVSIQNIEVEMYSIRKRINTIYFGILILEEQLAQNSLLIELLEGNYNKVVALIKNGVAMQSDADAIRVEILLQQQQRVHINSKSVSYRKVLSIFTGKESLSHETLLKPKVEIPIIRDIKRPELKLFNAQLSTVEAQKELINSSTKPTFGAFGRGFYGNPGLNAFQDMIDDNRFTFNYVVGVKMQWNFGRYYTKRNSINKLSVAQQQLNNRRETFLFNTSLQTSQEQQTIYKMQQVMAEDNKIIALRRSIREGAEAKLENGVVDVNDLLREITAESAAKLARTAHEIELLKSIYDLKNIINN